MAIFAEFSDSFWCYTKINPTAHRCRGQLKAVNLQLLVTFSW